MERAQDQARNIAARIDGQLGNIDTLLIGLAQVVSLNPDDIARNEALFRAVRADLPPYFVNVKAHAPDGHPLGSSSGNRESNVLDRRYFYEALEGAGFVVGDAVISRIAVPLTKSESIYGSVLMYKEGQSFLLYVADHYGEERIWDMLDNWWRYDTFEQVFEKTIGRRLADVDEEWFQDLRRRYYPAVATASTPGESGRRYTRKGSFNLGPRVLPSRSPADTTVRFCYFSAGETAIELKINEPDGRGGRRERRVLRGHQSPEFESFHLF